MPRRIVCSSDEEGDEEGDDDLLVSGALAAPSPVRCRLRKTRDEDERAQESQQKQRRRQRSSSAERVGCSTPRRRLLPPSDDEEDEPSCPLPPIDDDDEEPTCTGSTSAEQRSKQGFEHAAIVLEDSDDERDGECPDCGEPWGTEELVGCDGNAGRPCSRWVHLSCAGFGSSAQATAATYVCSQCRSVTATAVCTTSSVDRAPRHEGLALGLGSGCTV